MFCFLILYIFCPPNPLSLSYKKLVFFIANVYLLNPSFMMKQFMYTNRNACLNQLLALINLAMIIWVSVLSPS